jgi:hypothetical protein
VSRDARLSYSHPASDIGESRPFYEVLLGVEADDTVPSRHRVVVAPITAAIGSPRIIRPLRVCADLVDVRALYNDRRIFGCGD